MALGARTHPGPIGEGIGSNPSRAGDYNQRLVLQTIRAKGQTTYAEIAAICGLTHQSALNIARRLSSDDLVMEVGKTSGQRGQPAALLQINPKGAYSLGLNIDRYHLTLVAMDLTGEIKFRAHREIAFPLPSDVLAFLQAEVAGMLTRRIMPKKRLIGLGIAIPDGMHNANIDDKPPEFQQWASTDIAAVCREALGLPVFSANDATSAAIGEHRFGKGAEFRNFTYVLVSAGLGCGMIIDGKPYTGGKNHAGEIGNIPISRNGKRTILWDVVSLYALYGELARSGFTVSSTGALEPNNPAMMVAIDRWIDAAVSYMIEPFLSLNYILSPEINFIGGQLPRFIVERLCERLNRQIVQFETYTPITLFMPSTISNDASALGAAVTVFQHKLLP